MSLWLVLISFVELSKSSLLQGHNVKYYHLSRYIMYQRYCDKPQLFTVLKGIRAKDEEVEQTEQISSDCRAQQFLTILRFLSTWRIFQIHLAICIFFTDKETRCILHLLKTPDWHICWKTGPRLKDRMFFKSCSHEIFILLSFIEMHLMTIWHKVLLIALNKIILFQNY